LSLGVENQNSKAQDLMLHLEMIAKSKDEFLAKNAIYLMARVFIADRRFPEA
jgi:hypothetical protein